MDRDIVPANAAGNDVVPYDEGIVRDAGLEPESAEEASQEGRTKEWEFWEKQIRAGLLAERRWRSEALQAERMYFGPDEDPGAHANDDPTPKNQITDKTALIHSNIDVLKPLVFSETPTPIVRRRFRGDGKQDETDLMAAEAGQRIATYLLDVEDFDDAMKAARDDWLITGRGASRVLYKAEFGVDANGFETKVDERACIEGIEWSRLVTAPGHGWNKTPWLSIEVPMTRKDITDRFGEEKAAMINFKDKGLIYASERPSDSDDRRAENIADDTDTGNLNEGPFDTVSVWEIWDRQRHRVVWWTNGCRDILDESDDPLELQKFWPMAKPLLASTKGQKMTPRPDLRYYEQRAREIDLAAQKLESLLNVISVSALFPAALQTEVKSILDGKNKMIPIAEWMKLLEKGGTNNIIQWLPLDAIVNAVNALIILREQAKQAMFEHSGVSDVMRAQGDPSATATQEAIKGRYANLRLSDRQRTMAVYALRSLELMIEIAVEFFDPARLAAICALGIPNTEAERAMLMEQQEQERLRYEATVQAHQILSQSVPPEQMPAPPQEPQFDRIPETSFELVLARLRNDFLRNITVQIETQSTVLADEQADKEARVEFLSAFSNFVAQLAPMANAGQFDFKTMKELLLFGVRGFPKSRTLEAMIASLPDEPQGDNLPDTQVQVAQIKAEVDKLLKEMDLADKDKQRGHELRLQGVDLTAEAARIAGQPGEQPQPAQGGPM